MRWSLEAKTNILDEQLIEMAAAFGFEASAPLDVSTIKLKREVRDMCWDNSCGQYARRWSCPPGCGDLEECAERLKTRTRGILVQTIGEIEDSFDVESMAETESAHKRRLLEMSAALRKTAPNVLVLGAGCCTKCGVCTYPDAPCRFPEEMISSMEAYGILVLEVCKDNHLPYYYGPHRIAYTSCFLL